MHRKEIEDMTSAQEALHCKIDELAAKIRETDKMCF